MISLRHNPPSHYSFTRADIAGISATAQTWLDGLRTKEIEMTLSALEHPQFVRALELGCGEGVQSAVLTNVCDHLICTEYGEHGQAFAGAYRGLQNDRVEFVPCDAQDLSHFDDNSFDLVYSSNVMEHIPDLKACLSEQRRVLLPDGLAIHTMPTPYWKIAHMVFGSLLWRKIPMIHGQATTHLDEWDAFREKTWLRVFNENGFECIHRLRLPFYMGVSNNFLGVTELGNRLGLNATTGYFLRPVPQ